MMISVNGIAVDTGRWPSGEVAAVRELLRQRAVACEFLLPDVGDNEEIGRAIEHLLVEEVRVAAPTKEEYRSCYNAHRKEFRSGALVHARHILFEVTPGVAVAELRAQGERTRADLLRAPERFDAVACELSNCRSRPARRQSRSNRPRRYSAGMRTGAIPFGGDGNPLRGRQDAPRLSYRSGRSEDPGKTLLFEAMRERIVERLKASVEERALRQYISDPAGPADIIGVELQGAQTPLVQNAELVRKPALRGEPMNSIYPHSTPDIVRKRRELTPNQLSAFEDFGKAVFADGALPAKFKQIIAVAVAHVTQCPYCITGHTKAALRSGATPQELMEAIWVAAEMRAGGAYAHSTLMLTTAGEEEGKAKS